MQNSQIANERDDCGVPMERSQINNERDDCGVPWIRTYSPERARMGTDTDHDVYPPIVPVKGDSTARQRPSKMQNSQIADEREDYGTLSVCTPQLFLSKEIQPKGQDLAMFADQQ